MESKALDLNSFTERLNAFIENNVWTFASTMPEWPHEYIVRKQVDETLFIETILHIRTYGYQGYFYQLPITYFEDNGRVYWTMGAPLGETIIINRCRKEDTYEERLKNGTLPAYPLKP